VLRCELDDLRAGLGRPEGDIVDEEWWISGTRRSNSMIVCGCSYIVICVLFCLFANVYVKVACRSVVRRVVRRRVERNRKPSKPTRAGKGQVRDTEKLGTSPRAVRCSDAG
jgi:hypothetical protein